MLCLVLAQILNYEVKQEPCLRKGVRDEDKEVDDEEEEEEEVLDAEDSRTVYTGSTASCTVAGLKPGRGYLYQVRASNKAGSGPWSPSLHVMSGPGVPEEPKPPVVFCRGPHAAAVSWQAPASNGADITEFRLEWQSRPDGDFSTVRFLRSVLMLSLPLFALSRRLPRGQSRSYMYFYIFMKTAKIYKVARRFFFM